MINTSTVNRLTWQTACTQMLFYIWLILLLLVNFILTAMITYTVHQVVCKMYRYIYITHIKLIRKLEHNRTGIFSHLIYLGVKPCLQAIIGCSAVV